jgi:CubicO group peptidase (beta-lactamase class C family)
MELDRARLDGVLDEAVRGGAVPGAVAVVAEATTTRYERAVGTHDVLTGEPMSTASVFRIASMTKLATVIATASCRWRPGSPTCCPRSPSCRC